jgi:predicted transcriptional regulator
MLKFILESQQECFETLSKSNQQSYEKYDDEYFKGKAQAYALAAEAVQEILKNYAMELDNTTK